VTTAPLLEASKGRLQIAERTLGALVAHAADPVAAALEPGAEEELVALRAAGVIEGGRAHPAIADGLAAIVRPTLCTLELDYAGKAMRGWVSTEGAALLLPARDGEQLRTLISLHPTLLPEALARLVDLGPRPRPDATAPVAPETVGDVRRRWRLSAAWESGGAGLEILDAADGLWLLHDTLAWPVTPTFVWRHIVRILMRRGG
jgi:hypothetical protein